VTARAAVSAARCPRGAHTLEPRKPKSKKRKQATGRQCCVCSMQLHEVPSLIPWYYLVLPNSHNKNAYSVHYGNPCQPLEHQNLRKLANTGAHRASKHPPHQSYSELRPPVTCPVVGDVAAIANAATIANTEECNSAPEPPWNLPAEPSRTSGRPFGIKATEAAAPEIPRPHKQPLLEVGIYSVN
jgi:hypothetical protein